MPQSCSNCLRVEKVIALQINPEAMAIGRGGFNGTLFDIFSILETPGVKMSELADSNKWVNQPMDVTHIAGALSQLQCAWRSLGLDVIVYPNGPIGN